jgi:hypothetical protein
VTQVDEGPESLRTPDVLTVGAPAVGEVLAERYRLEEHISDDAYGRQVWRGLDVLLRRPIAVILRQPGGELAVEMLQSAVKASRVAHPHLVAIYDAVDEGGKAYVVREWVEGISLRDAVAETPMDPDRATTVTHAIAGAVAAFHAAGLTHGNIHPGTVLLADEGQVLLTDARSDDSATPDADVRAIGGVLYAALTGHWPHREVGGASLPDAVRDPTTEAPLPVRRIRGGVPDHLSDLAADLLDTDQAPPSADVLTADLSRLDAGPDDELLDPGDQYGIGGGFLPISNRLETRRPAGRKLAVGVALLLVLAVVGLLIGFAVLGDGKKEAATPRQSGPTAGTVTRPDGGQTTPLALKASQLSLVSPNGDHDNADDLGNVVDGKPGTAWATQHYNDNSDYFTNEKKGLGILIDLGSPQSVSELKVDFTNPGATVQLKKGDFPSTGGSDGDQKVVFNYTAVGQPEQCGATHDFLLPADEAPTRYLLVLITGLPVSADSASKYQVGISEIKVSVNQ